MKTMIRKFMISMTLASLSLSAWSAQVLSLEDIRSKVLNDNVDIEIQYEKYYQAQQNVKVKLGEFLPSLDFQLLYWNSTYSLLYSVVPTPSGWFEYEASKEFAIAEKFVSDSIRLNILRDLTLNYINILHQPKMLTSLLDEERVLEEVAEVTAQREDLGLATASDTFTAMRALMQHRQQIYALNSIIETQREALYLSMGELPTDEIELVDFQQNVNNLPATVAEAVELGLKNAPELKANLFMTEGARHMTQSARWSFISFSGIGFGYPSALRIEKSKAREIELKRQKIENEISNQIAYAYSKLDNINARIMTQIELVEMAQEHYNTIAELYEREQASLEEYIKAKKSLLAEKRSLTTLEMKYELAVANTKRLLGLDAAGNDQEQRDESQFDLVAQSYDISFGRKKVSVDINTDILLLDEIVSVSYSGDVFSKRVVNVNGNLSLYTKIRDAGEKLIKAEILLANGQIINLEKMITL